ERGRRERARRAVEARLEVGHGEAAASRRAGRTGRSRRARRSGRAVVARRTSRPLGPVRAGRACRPRGADRTGRPRRARGARRARRALRTLTVPAQRPLVAATLAGELDEAEGAVVARARVDDVV